MPDYGFKVSQAGYDTTAAKERLIFSSAFDTFKVFMTGSGTITVAAAADIFTQRLGTVTIAHSLGYRPAFWVNTDNPLWYTAGQLAPYTSKAVGISSYAGIDYAVDTTNVVLYFNNPLTTQSVDFEYHYYIFYNELVA